jgi:heptosyltransferase I
MRVLFVKTGSLGNIISTLAVVRRARARTVIAWVVEQCAAEIPKDNPLVDRLIEVNTKALRRWPVSGETLLAPRQQLQRLRASAFDLAIAFQSLLESAASACLCGAAHRYGFTRAHLREWARLCLLTDTVNISSLTVERSIIA